MEDPVMVKNFNNDLEEDELLKLVNEVIEENVLINIINKFLDEDTEYLKAKNREIRWLAAKVRFRAIEY
ncbi:hypothetical protein [Methanobacterium petrolearium]|uniref:hypothetical protein n=1 Tax=Methanobacterium petrolearium TaxID=710190 RepID=UPI001AE23D58|nr:hypothetical protein [Methanobacterium petrolearium]MBP1945039.1 hypothetical protein [Methanobacterium petrolearium]BDZ70366.1 hypothetical protein GCM10025861_08830 [Methanobacterium petrolearium]